MCLIIEKHRCRPLVPCVTYRHSACGGSRETYWSHLQFDNRLRPLYNEEINVRCSEPY